MNEGNQLKLKVVDSTGQIVTDVTFSSGSPDVASVDQNSGIVTGLQRGFATITARRSSGETASTFLAVARVESARGKMVMGDTKVDTSGAVYLSDPLRNIILKKDPLIDSEVTIFAGQSGKAGLNDGDRLQALFRAPVGMAIDNRIEGGIYVADTLNHSIRKIAFNNKVETVLGKGAPGINKSDETPFEQAMFDSPQGVATGRGGLFIADTNNHAIYFADLKERKVRLLAGEPGISGKTDGMKQTATFKNPTALTVQSLSTSLFGEGGVLVADTGNNCIRLVTFDGNVTTLGPTPKNAAGIALSDQTEFLFNEPISVSADGVGNIYVVDKSGVKVITEPMGQMRQVVSLAQPGPVSFGQAVSMVVRGTEIFVLDANATTEAEAVKVVTVGAPEISSLSQNSDLVEGGAEVIITGKNFAPESLVLLGDLPVTNLVVESATTIRFRVPQQTASGIKTLSVRTRGGVAQRLFNIIPRPLSELASGEITTIAGSIPFVGDGGIATSAGLNSPQTVAVDGAGNLFIADFNNNRIRRVDAATGVITTVAGNGSPGFSGDGGPAVSAGLNSPQALAVDGAGNLFITDIDNNRIRRVDAATGIITTVAGNGSPGLSGDGGPAINASLNGPIAVAVDGAGNLFIADFESSRIRRVDAATGIITTVAGNGSPGFSGDGGPAINASLAKPVAVAVDNAGNLFIAGLDDRVRRVDAATNIITTVAGNGSPGFSGDGGPAISARLDKPLGIEADGMGNLFITDADNNRIRRVDAATGIITTVVGNGSPGFSGDGGPAISASLNGPAGVAVDGAGNLFIADFNNNRIRQVTVATGIVTTVAGNGSEGSSEDGGPAISASLDRPVAVAADKAGNLFIADFNENRIRRVDAATGVITTVAGNGNPGFSGDGGPATSARLNRPVGVTVDGAGNLFITDFNNNRIRRVDAATGIITTPAGPVNGANLNGPGGIAVDGAGNLFIADAGNNRIRRFDAATGIITTLAGNGSPGFSGDGGPAINASLSRPVGLAVDGAGNLFITDFNNNRIRRVDAATGIITTVAGNGSPGFSGDGGPAISSSLNGPVAVAVDGAGNLFIADAQNILIRRVDAATGIITTVAGNGSPSFSGDDGPATSAGFYPSGIAVDGAGNLFIADAQNNRIRAVKGIATGQGGQRQVVISNVSFSKSNLTISGSGFTVFGASVVINGKNSSNFITSQTDTLITLKGNKKKLNLRKGTNQITVTVGAVTSNTFTFKL